jgi:hypothetical protein
LAAPSGKTMIGSTFGENKLIDSTFWEKHDWQHILGKTMIHSTFCKKNLISSTFWKKTLLTAHSREKKHD